MKTTRVNAASGHCLYIEKVEPTLDHPADANIYTDFYVVKNFDAQGVVFFYMAKGYHESHAKAPREIHVWYRNRKMWTGFGTSFEKAINGAQRDGWMHAE